MKTIITIAMILLCLAPVEIFSQSNIDAAFDYGNGKIYFFTGDQYYRYDKAAKKMDAGYPRSIATNWAGVWHSDLDAACSFTKSIYFFKGNECIKYDKATKARVPGYPKKISGEFRGVEGPVDAVFQKGERIYFFKGKGVYKYNQSSEKASGMQDIKDVADIMPFSTADAALRRAEVGIYLFSGQNYARFSESGMDLHPGYPKTISRHWGLPLRETSSTVQQLGGEVLNQNGFPAEGIKVIIQKMGGSDPGRTHTVTNEKGIWKYESTSPSTIVTVRDNCGAVPDPGEALKSKKSGLSYLVNLGDGNLTDLDFRMNCTVAGSRDEPFTFQKGKPKVIFLIHGISPAPGSANAVNTPRHPMGYWGYDMILRLAGYEYFPLPGKSDMSTEDRSLKVFEGGRVTQKFVTRDRWNKIQKNDLPPVSTAPYAFYNQSPENGLPPVSVVPLYRDGAARLKTQVTVTVDDIYRYYNHLFGNLPATQQPQIILLSHSFGGIVSRFLLTNPQETFNGSEMLDPARKQKADFIRDRTLFLITLATPHNNSPLPGYAKQIDQKFAALARMLRLKDKLPVSFATDEVKSALDDLADVIENNEIRNEYIGGNRPCMADFEIMDPDKVNQGILSPEKMKRTDGSLIPVYALGGRSPGHNFFDIERSLVNPMEISCWDITEEPGKEGQNAFMLMMTDNLLGILSNRSRPWGNAVYKPGDQVTLSEKMKMSWVDINIPSILLWDFHCKRNQINDQLEYGDGEYDNDGFVGFDSAMGFFLGTDTPDYFDHKKTWTVNTRSNRGSWYRIYQGRYGEYFPWDWDNHSTIRKNEATGIWLYRNLIRQAGPLPGAGLWSVWRKADTDRDDFEITVNKIKVKIHSIEQIDDLDIPDEADFFASVQVGHRYLKPSLTIDNQDKISPGWQFEWQGTGDLIPVRIIVTEHDESELTAGDNDRVSINPTRGKEDLFLIFDVKNGVIFSERGVIAKKSHIFSTSGHNDDNNRAKIRLSIDGFEMQKISE